MFFVYVINSHSKKYIYVGLTSNIENRLVQHNKGKERTTKPYLPFDLIYTEKYSTRVDARKREKQLESDFGKEWIKKEFGL
jgi:putative endonuclease